MIRMGCTYCCVCISILTIVISKPLEEEGKAVASRGSRWERECGWMMSRWRSAERLLSGRSGSIHGGVLCAIVRNRNRRLSAGPPIRAAGPSCFLKCIGILDAHHIKSLHPFFPSTFTTHNQRPFPHLSTTRAVLISRHVQKGNLFWMMPSFAIVHVSQVSQKQDRLLACFCYPRTHAGRAQQ